MKVTIHCDNAFEARRALGGTDAWLVLRALDEEMRRLVKNCDADDADIDAAVYWCSRLAALCDDYRVDLDDDEEVTP